MFNVGGGEILVIMVLALIVLGPDKLPEAAKQAGKYLSEFRRMSHGFQQEIRSAMDLNPLNDKSSGTSASGSSSAASAPSLPPLPVNEAPGANLSSAADNVPPAMRTPPPEPRGDISVDGPSGSFS
jgi:Tat protein translocase TatB subunit